MFTEIKNYIEKALREHNLDNTELWEDGAIYYANGNDGTDFDWECNGRTCEFMVYHKNGWGAIKVFYTDNNMMEGWVFPNPETPMDAVTLEKVESRMDVENIKDYLIDFADGLGNYDEKLSVIERN